MLPSAEEQQEKVVALRKSLSPSELTSASAPIQFSIERWLIARKWDVSSAAAMLTASLKWRENCKLDGILEEKFPSEVAKTPIAYLGSVRKDAGPPTAVFLHQMQKTRPTSDLKVYGDETMERFLISVMEAKLAKMVQMGDTSSVQIADLDELPCSELFSTRYVNFLIKMQAILDTNYPELTSLVVMINAPSFCAFIFKILKQFMAKETVDRVQVFGRVENDLGWQTCIREQVGLPLEKIPADWGGKLDLETADVWMQGKV